MPTVIHSLMQIPKVADTLMQTSEKRMLGLS